MSEGLDKLRMAGIADRDLVEALLLKYQAIINKKSERGSSVETLVEHIVSYYEDIINCLPGNVYWLDNEAKAVGCNKNVLDMFDLKTLDEFKGLSFEDMGRIGHWSKETTQSFKRDTFDVLQTGNPKLNIEEPPIPHSDGRIIYFLTSRVPLFNHQGAVIGVVGISIDITELRNAQEDLKRAKEQAEAANQLKSEFIQNMEHDIRTPFNGVWGLANLLYEQEVDSDKKQLLGYIANSAKELLGYCNNILDFSKTEAEALPVLEKKFSLKALIDHVIAIERPAAVLKHLQFELDYDLTLPELLIGDEYRLKCILINLLSNSIKFTHAGSVNLKVALSRQDDKRYVIINFIVSDTGIGIPQEKQSLVYEKFVRLMPSNQGIYKGMGLGLHVVKRYVAELDGDIELMSSPEKGTTFICTLPLKVPLVAAWVGEKCV